MAYANGDFIPNAADYIPRWQAKAAAFVARQMGGGRAQMDLPYGRTERSLFDLMLPEGTPKGLVVFVHGGYWLRFDKSVWTHLAAGPVLNGWAVALPSYDLCPDVRIGEIGRQVAQAISVAAEHVAGPIALTGHSAGGHLVARMMAAAILPVAVAGRVTSCVPISPVADLAPLMHTSMNADLRIDDAEARRESPVHLEDRLPADVTVWVGAAERPVFLDQARWLAEAWDSGLHIAEGRHHFDVIDALEDPASALCWTLLGLT
ncbi:alpha/beta hydrolase [Pseudaestuariivita sp.]|uniref:alpha/beta hydrolase n=1 Tax=Pseudaestuariivita sp. TaxID=2211669 RepID=UPI004059F603